MIVHLEVIYNEKKSIEETSWPQQIFDPEDSGRLSERETAAAEPLRLIYTVKTCSPVETSLGVIVGPDDWPEAESSESVRVHQNRNCTETNQGIML